MGTFYDKSGRAIIRLYDNWFVAYTEARHLGWLSSGDAIYNNDGKHIGWLTNGVIQDANGYRIADQNGSILPGMAGIPGQPGMKGFSGLRISKHAVTSQWSEMTYRDFFGI